MKRLFFVSVLLAVLVSAGYSQDTVHVKSGWNIIGSMKTGPVETVLTSIPDTIIISAFYGYNPGSGYQSTDTLGSGTGYWVKVNSDGVIVFNTPTPQDCGRKLVIYGKKVYHTVQIGEHCWFDENLNVGVEVAGTETQTDNGTIEKYCYDDDSSNCLLYGGLYQWDEAMQYVTDVGARGICPEGWHVATYSEIQALSSSVGGDGNALKAVGQGAGDGAGTNAGGFSSLLGGFRSFENTFNHLGYAANIWSSTENDSENGYNLTLFADNNDVAMLANLKASGFSVRCVED